MFCHHQIDLSLKNTPFIHISSVSFSLIMSSTVRYIILMFVPRSPKTLYFDEHNITKFLECFEKQDNKYEIIEKKKMNQAFSFLCQIHCEVHKDLFFIYWSKLKNLWKEDTKRVQKSRHRINDQFAPLSGKIQEQS